MRQAELLQAAAQAFEEGIDPFSAPWLAEHAVTGQECFDLTQFIAAILKGYLAFPAEEQIALLVWGILKEAGFSEAAARAMHYHDVVKAFRKALEGEKNVCQEN